MNAPVPTKVQLSPDGAPVRLLFRGRPRQVEAVQERWRIDEGWWRGEPVSRFYWRLVLADGRLVTVYQDLGDGTWWSQRA